MQIAKFRRSCQQPDRPSTRPRTDCDVNAEVEALPRAIVAALSKRSSASATADPASANQGFGPEELRIMLAGQLRLLAHRVERGIPVNLRSLRHALQVYSELVHMDPAA